MSVVSLNIWPMSCASGVVLRPYMALVTHGSSTPELRLYFEAAF